MNFLIVFFVCALHQTSGVIYYLNETEYDRLPPLFKLDEFNSCLRAPGDRYCYVDARLTANTSSELLHVIQEYSASNITHYDHNFIHWGICVTKICRQYLGNDTDLNVALEACINASLYQSYQLQARLVEDQVYCTDYGESVPIDTGDLVVAVVFMAILALNLLGSLYDHCCVSDMSLETEYDRLPPLFKLDEFYPCLRASGDRYCYVDARLTANTSSELLHVIQEYSASNITHYDHNFIHWGICVTKTCRQYLGNDTDLNVALEACINASLYQSHQLQARLVEDQVYCTDYGESVPIDTGDLAVAVVFMVILALNLLGSLYDNCWVSDMSLAGRVLRCFSVKRNWRRLIAPSGENPEPRLRRLKMFNGVKACTTFLVVFGHSPLPALITSSNTHFIELSYYNPLFHIFANGNLIVQTFFLLSGFLLAFHQLVMEEKRRVSWKQLPQSIMLRWMRLTPPYAAMLAIIATWMRHLGIGPMWKTTVGAEVDACRRDWYYHLLYINDYVDYSQCMGHTWYLAADMKLTIAGLLIFLLLRSSRARLIAVGTTLVASVLTTAAQIYFQDLNAILLLSPEVARHYLVEDPTFNKLYKRGHANIICYAMGLALGMLVYKLMKTNFDVSKYKKYRLIYWASIPAAVLLVISGGIFYMDGVQVPLAVRVLYSSLVKILYGTVFFVLILGTVFKLETVYRGILEWRGWAVFWRVSYCAFLVHVSVVRYSAANHTSLLHSNFFQILVTYFGLLLTTFVVAFPCWMLIEAPFNQLVKVCFYPAPSEQMTKTEIAATPTPVLVISKK